MFNPLILSKQCFDYGCQGLASQGLHDGKHRNGNNALFRQYRLQTQPDVYNPFSN